MKTESTQGDIQREDHRLYESGNVLFNTGFLAHIKDTIYWALCVPGTLPNTTCVISFSPQKHPLN